ncbi:hypothetical protein [Plasmodium yoelii yoelii]|nr:hypothetical protein [Plasmodium yoelii yoelii]
MSIILLNIVLVKEFDKIKKNNPKKFEILNAYLCIDRNCQNEFLYSFFDSNVEQYEQLIIKKMSHESGSESGSKSGSESGRSANWEEQVISGTQLYIHKTEDDFFSENNYVNSAKIVNSLKQKQNEKKNEKKKQNEISITQSSNEPNVSQNCSRNQNCRSVGDVEKREPEQGLEGLESLESLKNCQNFQHWQHCQNFQHWQHCESGPGGFGKKGKKANPLFLLKSGIVNPFLMIDIDKSTLDLYTFLLKRNYLNILLFLINICLSSEYFIYDFELYKNFLIYLEEHDIGIYNFLEKFEGIDKISCMYNDSDKKYDLKFIKKNEKKLYIFLLSINLLLELISVYPTESIMIINENKLLEIKNINELYLSNLIINSQINELENISKNYISTTYYYDKFHKTLTFKFKITEDDDSQNFEGVTAKLSLSFMPNYPFSVLVINDKIESLGMPKNKIKNKNKK